MNCPSLPTTGSGIAGPLLFAAVLVGLGLLLLLRGHRSGVAAAVMLVVGAAGVITFAPSRAADAACPAATSTTLATTTTAPAASTTTTAVPTTDVSGSATSIPGATSTTSTTPSTPTTTVPATTTTMPTTTTTPPFTISDLSPLITAPTSVGVGGDEFSVQINNVGSADTTGPIVFVLSINPAANFDMAFDPATTSVTVNGTVTPVSNSSWTAVVDATANTITFTAAPGFVIPAGASSTVGLSIAMNPGNIADPANITATVTDGGGETNTANNTHIVAIDAEPVPLVCPTGILPAVVNGGAVSTTFPVLGNVAGAVTFGSPFALDTSAVDPAIYGTSFGITPVSTSITTSTTPTPTTYTSSTGLPSGTGTVGGVTASPGAPIWSNIALPNGTYTAGSGPRRFVTASISYSLTFTSPTSGEVINCAYTLAWTVNGNPTGTVVIGAANMAFNGSVTPLP